VRSGKLRSFLGAFGQHAHNVQSHRIEHADRVRASAGLEERVARFEDAPSVFVTDLHAAADDDVEGRAAVPVARRKARAETHRLEANVDGPGRQVAEDTLAADRSGTTGFGLEGASNDQAERDAGDECGENGRSEAHGRHCTAGTKLATAAALVLLAGGCGGDKAEPVAYSQVQSVWEKYGCTGCHPGVNSSLDLREGRSYAALVGIAALEDPSLTRVVAGDPERSFLYLKLGGASPLGDIPAIGTRMPPRAPPIDADDLELVRDWIEQGAKDENGRTGGPRVATPGTPPTDLDVDAATRQRGSGRITGTVLDQRRRPLAGALVTLLLTGESQEGGEEHYRVAITNASGAFALGEAPVGRYLLKAYGPNTIYVSRIVAVDDRETERIRFGLPDRRVENPQIAAPRVAGRELSMTVTGDNLDGNYTLAVNRDSGLVFELHSADNAPGTWRARAPAGMSGPWIFLAVDENCNVSEFLTVGS